MKIVGRSPDAGITDLFSGDLSGAVVTSLLTIVICFALFYRLFDLSNDAQSWQFVLLGWVVLTFIAGLAIHMAVDPPPRTAPYVPPAQPSHFTIGN